MPDEGKIRDVAEVVEGIVKAVPIYEDALQRATWQIGSGLETIAKTINVALAPLKGLVWGYDRIENYLIPALAERLKKVPEERVVTPEPSVAGPAIEALRFAGHEPSLRELYANLLATSMDKKTAREAHPSFVEIIRQLTPDEARIVELLAHELSFPLISVYAQVKNGRGRHYDLQHFSLLGYEAGCLHSDLVPSYLDNLCRLGLAEIPDGYEYARPDIYEPLEKHPVILELMADIEKLEDMKPIIEREFLHLTTLGKQFCDACVVEHDRS